MFSFKVKHFWMSKMDGLKPAFGEKGQMGNFQLTNRCLKRYNFTLLFFVASVVLFLLWFRCSHTPRPRLVSVSRQNFTLVILPKSLADTTGAYCLDGGPPSYYIRRAKSSKTQGSWFVVLQGGGWCWNVSDCYNRSLTELGSSYKLLKEKPFFGMMSANSTVNPEFYDWNMVMINYCDGASFSGNLESPVRFNNSNIYYRGSRILKLVMHYLLSHVGLAQAKHIILGGVSAGGLAVFLHVDYIRSLIPTEIPVHGVVDAGFFLDEKNISDHEHYRPHMQEILNMQNAAGSLNEKCLKALSSEDQWMCFFAEYTYRFITTPLFIVNSAYDYWQQYFILDLRCHPLQCPDKLKFLMKHRDIFMYHIQQVYHHAKDGMFITSCYAHSQVFHDDTWMLYAVNEKTVRQAFSDWYFARTKPEDSRYLDCSSDYHCNPSCARSWTLAFYKNVTDHMKKTTPDF